MPESTHHFAPAADNWSPAPTAAPQFNLFGRDNQQATDNTCGYVSGLSGTYLSLTTITLLIYSSIFCHLPKLQTNMRNKYLLWRARLLRIVRPVVLYYRDDMHTL